MEEEEERKSPVAKVEELRCLERGGVQKRKDRAYQQRTTNRHGG